MSFYLLMSTFILSLRAVVRKQNYLSFPTTFSISNSDLLQNHSPLYDFIYTTDWHFAHFTNLTLKSAVDSYSHELKACMFGIPRLLLPISNFTCRQLTRSTNNVGRTRRGDKFGENNKNPTSTPKTVFNGHSLKFCVGISHHRRRNVRKFISFCRERNSSRQNGGINVIFLVRNHRANGGKTVTYERFPDIFDEVRLLQPRWHSDVFQVPL